MKPDTNPNDVAAVIRQAFDALEPPIENDLAPHDCEECEELRATLRLCHFDEVPDESLDRLYSSLPLLGPKGLQYYLPAFLLRVLKDPDWFGIEHLLFHLNPNASDFAERGDYWNARLTLFTTAQKQAILAFLAWLESTRPQPTYLSEIVGAREVWQNAT